MPSISEVERSIPISGVKKTACGKIRPFENAFGNRRIRERKTVKRRLCKIATLKAASRKSRFFQFRSAKIGAVDLRQENLRRKTSLAPSRVSFKNDSRSPPISDITASSGPSATFFSVLFSRRSDYMKSKSFYLVLNFSKKCCKGYPLKIQNLRMPFTYVKTDFLRSSNPSAHFLSHAL